MGDAVRHLLSSIFCLPSPLKNMAKKSQASAPLLHQQAGGTDDHLPSATAQPLPGPHAVATPEMLASTLDAFLVEVFSVKEDGADWVMVEAGRGQTIRARKADVDVFGPKGSALQRVRLRDGKYRYE